MLKKQKLQFLLITLLIQTGTTLATSHIVQWLKVQLALEWVTQV